MVFYRFKLDDFVHKQLQELLCRVKRRILGSGVRPLCLILLKNPTNASTRLSMNGKSPMISTAPPFVLRFSKDERRVFQQNLCLYNLVHL